MITPRTDAAIIGDGFPTPVVYADFARQLETELIALQRWKEEHWDGNKQQWLNSTTTVCADFPNVAEYISQLEKERDQLLATVEGLREALRFYADQKDWDICIANGNVMSAKDGEPFSAFDKGEESPWKVAKQALQSLPPTNLVKCPCTIADDCCKDDCTCKNPLSSAGCSCCASYGSEEQRKCSANVIVDIMGTRSYVKRSVLEKLINVALMDDEQKASCGPICSRIIEEAREELERTKS